MQPTPSADDSFCIAVLGDFLGNAGRETLPPTGDWEPLRATPDTVLELLGLKPAVRFHLRDPSDPSRSQEVRIEFESLDDFGPESLFRRLELFAPAREARAAVKEGRSLLEGPSSGEASSGLASTGEPLPEPPSGDEPPAAGEGGTGEAETGREPTEGEGAEDVGGGDVLDAILDQAPEPLESPTPGGQEDLRRFVREIVRPHLVPSQEGQEEALARLDQEISGLMGEILHAPEFMELEAAWRSLVFLLSRSDSTGKTRVFLVPVTKSQLSHDLLSQEDLRRSRFSRLLSDAQLGAPGRRFAVLVGGFAFGPGKEDQRLLGRMAQANSLAQVPSIAGLDSRMVGAETPSTLADERDWVEPNSPEWLAFRQTQEARWVSLAMPRFLVREPYGVQGRPCKAFDFQEEISSRSDLPWGYGAFLCGALLSQAHSQVGWGFHPSDVSEMGGLPMTPGGGGDDPRPSPLEADLSSHGAQLLAEMGFVPLVAFPAQARVRVGGLRSLSHEGGILKGRWRDER